MKKDYTKEDIEQFLNEAVFSKRENILWFIDSYLLEWKDYSVYSKSKQKYQKFEAVRTTGQFQGNFDYNRGLLYITITTSFFEEGFQTRFIITNIDDGVWSAESKVFNSIDECNEFTNKLKLAYEKYEKAN